MSSNNKRAQEEAPEMGEPNKRRKFAQLKQDNNGSTMSCFEDLNNDCLVQVLSFLAIEEMNHVTLVNSRVCEARNDPSLDQTRSATIMVRRKNTNVLDFYETIASKKWARDVFASNSNKKVLHIVGCENLTRPRDVEIARLRSKSVDVQLPSITRLNVSCLDATNRHFSNYSVTFLFRSLPNLKEVNIIHSGTIGTLPSSNSVFRDNPALISIHWKNQDGSWRFSTGRQSGPLYLMALTLLHGR